MTSKKEAKMKVDKEPESTTKFLSQPPQPHPSPTLLTPSQPPNPNLVPNASYRPKQHNRTATLPTKLKADNSVMREANREPESTTTLHSQPQPRPSRSMTISSRPVPHPNPNPSPGTSDNDVHPQQRPRVATLPNKKPDSTTSHPKPCPPRTAPKPRRSRSKSQSCVQNQAENNLAGRPPLSTSMHPSLPPQYHNANAPAHYIEKVKALFDYTKKEDGELTITAGSIIYVTKKQADGGWDEGVCDGKTGIFPANYVEVLEQGNMNQSPPPVKYIEKVKVLFDYTKKEDGELTITKGSIVYVTKKQADGGWDEGVCDGKTGIFPANYVEVLEQGNMNQ